MTLEHKGLTMSLTTVTLVLLAIWLVIPHKKLPR